MSRSCYPMHREIVGRADLPRNTPYNVLTPLSISTLLLSTTQSKRRVSVMMTNHKNTDAIANDAEQKMIREPAQIDSAQVTLPN